MNENTILDVGGDAHIAPRGIFTAMTSFYNARAIVTLKL